MMRALALVALVPLAGCASTIAASIPSPSGYLCPKLADYAPDDQKKLYGELPSDGPESQTQLEDYAKLRKACGY
jgi:hypothetical protein